MKSHKSEKQILKRAKLSKSQDLMFALCDNPDKNLLCNSPDNKRARLVTKNDCTIECFNVNNPGMERAISDPNSPEAKHYGDKIKSRTKAAEGQTTS